MSLPPFLPPSPLPPSPLPLFLSPSFLPLSLLPPSLSPSLPPLSLPLSLSPYLPPSPTSIPSPLVPIAPNRRPPSSKRVRDQFSVELKPMEIRTFNITVEYI